MSEMLPAYIRIRQYVIRLLESTNGEEKKLPSENEFCKLFGVTRPTVRKALKELADEGEVIQKHGLGTFVNPVKRDSRINFGQQLKTIAVIIETGNYVHYSSQVMRLLASVYHKISLSGYRSIILSLTQKKNAFVQELKELKVDGVCWVNPQPQIFDTVEAINNANIPLVSACHNYYTDTPDGNVVKPASYSCVKLAAETLIKRGHGGRSLLVGPKRKFGNVSSVVKIFKKRFAESNLEFDTENMVIEATPDLVERIKKRVRLKIDFTAIYTRGRYYKPIKEGLDAASLRIPEDISLLIEEDGWESLYNRKVNFSLIACPLDKIGKTAAQILTDTIEGNLKKPQRKSFKAVYTPGDTLSDIIKKSGENSRK